VITRVIAGMKSGQIQQSDRESLQSWVGVEKHLLSMWLARLEFTSVVLNLNYWSVLICINKTIPDKHKIK
jgi:hypothetical protein